MTTTDTGELAFLRESGDIELREYPLPTPEGKALLGEVVRTNICGSDLHIWEGHPVIDEAVLGHEVLCRITEMGDEVETDYAGEPVEVGDLIVPAYTVACDRCEYCALGERRLCRHALDNLAKHPDDPPHFHGTFGTHFYIDPDQAFVKISDDLDPSVVASANCALTQILYGYDEIGLDSHETVVIQGAGGLGLNAIAVADQMGCETIVVEKVDSRIEMAKAFGVDHVVDMIEYDTPSSRADRIVDLTNGMGADVGIELAGIPVAFTEGIQLLRDGGRYLEMGNIVPGETVDVDPAVVTRKSLDVVGRLRYDPTYIHRAVEFLQRYGDEYPFSDLLDREFPLKDVQLAMERSANRQVTRASIVPQLDTEKPETTDVN